MREGSHVKTREIKPYKPYTKLFYVGYGVLIAFSLCSLLSFEGKWTHTLPQGHGELFFILWWWNVSPHLPTNRLALSFGWGRDQVPYTFYEIFNLICFVTFETGEWKKPLCVIQFRASLLAVGLLEEEWTGKEENAFHWVRHLVQSEVLVWFCSSVSGWFSVATEWRSGQRFHCLYCPLHVCADLQGYKGWWWVWFTFYYLTFQTL